jgi:hypothetical protein
MKYAFKNALKIAKICTPKHLHQTSRMLKNFKKFPQMTFAVVDGVRHICDKVFIVPLGFEIKKLKTNF